MQRKDWASAVIAGLACAMAAPAFAASAAHGHELISTLNCAACHGVDMNTPADAAWPKLAGQYPDYLYYAMRQYQMGNANPMLGRADPVMHMQVQELSGSDLQDIAAWIASLPGDLTVKK